MGAEVPNRPAVHADGNKRQWQAAVEEARPQQAGSTPKGQIAGLRPLIPYPLQRVRVHSQQSAERCCPDLGEAPLRSLRAHLKFLQSQNAH